MSDRVERLVEFHGTRNFGGQENLLRQQVMAAGLYRSLDAEEARELARFAIDCCVPGKPGAAEEVLLCLACLSPGGLDAWHGALVDRRVFSPAVIYHGAGSEIAERVVRLLPGEDTNHMLLALAWIGDDVVRDSFRRWRDDPPDWAVRLYVRPHRYAEEAGWELTPDGLRRDLFARGCHPLVRPGEEQAEAGIARVVDDHEGSCRWCDRRMTTLLDLDPTAPGTASLGMPGRRIRIATCEVCTCLGTIFTRLGPDGTSTWHEANRRPDHTPERTEDWGILPRGCLLFGGRPRPWLESASSSVPGVRFSQVGGHPTWIQDAEYPRCPDCGRAMPFVAQLSNADYQEYGEGIYYLFACPDCGVAATGYQQS